MTIRPDRHGRVWVLTIDRPHVRNALDAPTMRELTEALRRAASDPDIRAVVLTGAGDRAFSAGMDLTTPPSELPAPADRPVNVLRDGYRLPVLAAVNGAALGGGFELALACDLRIAADHGYFALPEVARGIAATEGGTELPQRLPPAIALELGLTTARLPADRAYQLGLVNRVVPAAQVLPTALAMAEQIAAHSPTALRATKHLMRRSLAVDAVTLRAETERITAALQAGPDATEGAAAFLAKRAPTWATPSADE